MTSNIQVRIFDGFIEIWSPGLLPEGISTAMLRDKHESKPRNPKIAHVLHRAGLAEQWNTGTNRMIEACNECGIGIDFESVASSFVVRFTCPQRKEIHNSEDGIPKSSEKIIALLRDNDEISAQEIARILGISRRVVEKYLSALKKSGKIRRIGPDKGGKWETAEYEEELAAD